MDDVVTSGTKFVHRVFSHGSRYFDQCRIGKCWLLALCTHPANGVVEHQPRLGIRRRRLPLDSLGILVAGLRRFLCNRFRNALHHVRRLFGIALYSAVVLTCDTGWSDKSIQYRR